LKQQKGAIKSLRLLRDETNSIFGEKFSCFEINGYKNVYFEVLFILNYWIKNCVLMKRTSLEISIFYPNIVFFIIKILASQKSALKEV